MRHCHDERGAQALPLTILALCLACACAASTPATAPDAAPAAQPVTGGSNWAKWYPNGTFRELDDHQPTILLSTPRGAFALREAVLVKLDPLTLEQAGVVQLFGPVPELPKTGPATPEEANAAIFERARRLMPAAMFAHGNDLLILVGDRFFCVDAATLEVKVNVSVAEAEPANRLERLATLAREKPMVTQTGDKLYVLRGKRFLSINDNDGKIVAAGDLPDPMVHRFYPDGIGGLKVKAQP